MSHKKLYDNFPIVKIKREEEVSEFEIEIE